MALKANAVDDALGLGGQQSEVGLPWDHQADLDGAALGDAIDHRVEAELVKLVRVAERRRVDP